MHIALSDTPIHPQATPLSQVSVAGDLQDAVMQTMQRPGLNPTLQIAQGALVRYSLIIYPHPPTIGPAGADFLFGLPV
jgi:hypothetical protein